MSDKTRLLDEYNVIEKQIKELKDKADGLLKKMTILDVTIVGSASGRGFGEDMYLSEFSISIVSPTGTEEVPFDKQDFLETVFGDFIDLVKARAKDIDIVRIDYNLIDNGTCGSMYDPNGTDTPDVYQGLVIIPIDEFQYESDDSWQDVLD